MYTICSKPPLMHPSAEPQYQHTTPATNLHLFHHLETLQYEDDINSHPDPVAILSSKWVCCLCFTPSMAKPDCFDSTRPRSIILEFDIMLRNTTYIKGKRQTALDRLSRTIFLISHGLGISLWTYRFEFFSECVTATSTATQGDKPSARSTLAAIVGC